MMVREATWADFGEPDRGPFPGKHSSGNAHQHPYYFRTKRERAALVRRAKGWTAIRMAPDVCGTISHDLYFPVRARCDLSLPFGTIEPDDEDIRAS